MTFKNTQEGMEVLNWWVDACLEWCYARVEDGKFGDQRYLDDWATRYDCVHVCQHLGAGVAPWNVQQYAFKLESGKTSGRVLSNNQEFNLVFYHYHGFRYSSKNSYMIAPAVYKMDRDQIKHVYRPYVKALSIAEKQIKTTVKELIPYHIHNEFAWVKEVLGRYLVFTVRGYYKNFYTKRSFQYGFIY